MHLLRILCGSSISLSGNRYGVRITEPGSAGIRTDLEVDSFAACSRFGSVEANFVRRPLNSK
jgi:hypothetical protein